MNGSGIAYLPTYDGSASWYLQAVDVASGAVLLRSSAVPWDGVWAISVDRCSGDIYVTEPWSDLVWVSSYWLFHCCMVSARRDWAA